MSSLDLAPFRAPCPRCRAPIVRATGRSGLLLVLDAEPSPRGNLLLSIHSGQLLAGQLRRNQAAGARQYGQALHTIHPDCVPAAPARHRPGRTR